MKIQRYKYSYSQFVKTLLVLFLFLAAISPNAKAAYRWNANDIKYEYNVTEGYVHMELKYFNGNGSDILDENAGFASSDGYCDLSFGNVKVRIQANNEGNNLDVWTTSGYESYTWKPGRWSSGNADTADRYVDIYWYLGSDKLGVSQTISMSGVWWNRGATADQNIGSNTFSITPNYSIGNIASSSSPYFTIRDGKPQIAIPWNKSADGNPANTLGEITIYKDKVDDNNKKGSVPASSNNGTFYIPIAAEEILNTEQKYVIRQYHKVRNVEYIKTSSEIIVPAYPQVQNFKAELDDGTKRMVVTWNLSNSPSQNYKDDSFILVTKGEEESDVTNKIAYTYGQSTYSHSFEIPENRKDYKYTFEIYRSDQGAVSQMNDFSKYYKKTSEATISTDHCNISKVKAVLLEENETPKIKITWDCVGSIWSSGSKFVLSRINLTNNSAEDIELSRGEYDKKEYIDERIKICNEYQYKLQVKPNSSFSVMNPIYTEDSFSPTKSGDLNPEINVSKGYFPDRVEIDWKTDGGAFDRFIVKRKKYGESDDTYKQITTIEGTTVQTTYNAQDKDCIPGIVYEYKVVGLTDCVTVVESKTQPTAIGFRTPTGDIYGRLTFENGQAVKDVEVRLETKDEVPGYSYHLGEGHLQIDKADYLSGNKDSITLQAWIKPESTTSDTPQSIVKKENMYSLYIQSDMLYFRIGNATQYKTINSDVSLSECSVPNSYLHVSATYSKNSLKLYINGKCVGEKYHDGTASLSGTNSPVTFGEGFTGNIDEIRIWDKVLDATSISRNYNRYLAGNESGLIGYYTFDYSVEKEFYDTSYKGINYNGNHGTVIGNKVKLDAENIPTHDQLGYKGITSEDGSYTIHAVPYTGNGTSYTIIPRLESHTFSPMQEVRIINADAQNHTVNFTDKSSFDVQGFVTYYNSTIPVEGVMFTVDGVTVMKSNGSIIQTDSKGEFTISVPVGTHEVKAVKTNHIFANEGRITNSNGTDRNYQDNIVGIQLKDSTTIRYIGRVAGGAVQEAYPIGHSLSKNNLADGISLTLQYSGNESYKVAIEENTVTMDHFKPSNSEEKANQNDVKWTESTNIIIYPNAKTGEFIADIIPEKFSVTLNVPGKEYQSFSGGKGVLDLSNSFIAEESIYEYRDSVLVSEDPNAPVYEYTDYSDTVRYNKQQMFISRTKPTLRITQQDDRGKDLEYMGSSEVTVQNALGEKTKITLWSEDGGYTLGKPVFEQNAWYKFQAKAFESYPYYQADGELKEGVAADEVAVSDAEVSFCNLFCNKEGENGENVECDENGLASFEMQAQHLDLTTGTGNVEAFFKIGDDGTSTAWPGSFTAYFIGQRQQGNSFVTEGPNKIMFVLRDPPGSKSYAYLEKGASSKTTSTYNGSVTNTGSEQNKTYLGNKTVTFVGVGGGVITEVEVNNDLSVGISHEEQVSGSIGTERVVTTTTRFQTSDDPLYVGAGGDLYVGYSTNIVLGKTKNLTIQTREQYDQYQTSESQNGIIAEANGLVLVETEGIGVAERFSTLFAYPQLHIEGQLIPNLIDTRNRWLVLYTGTATDIKNDTEFLNAMQAKADATKSAVYASYLAEDNEDFGKSNDDETIADKTKGDPADLTNGPSYCIIYPKDLPEEKDANGNIIIADNDTINSINQSIKNWEKQIRANEQAKVKAKESNKPLQNYSFHAGSNIEYSESFTQTKENSQDFHITVGAKTAGELGMNVMAAGTSFLIEEEVNTEQGGSWSQTEETTQTQGFVFAEDGDDDYLTVDVYHEIGYEKDDQYIEYKDITSDKKQLSTMIFITRAGATGCPYEGEYTARYYEPEQKHVIDEATLQIEMPKISLPEGQQSLVENVPSGKSAYLPIVLTNESAINEDGWYDLKILDDTNPDGAQLFMDGAAIGNGRSIMIPAEGVLNKTLEIRKGKVMNYDNLQVAIFSQCQCDPTSPTPVISDTLNFSVHFTPSCSDVNIKKPSNNWTYNTKLPTTLVNGVDKHYMDVVIDGFDVNYDNFHHLKLQYKAASGSEDDWDKGTLMNFYNKEEYYNAAISAGTNATMIDAKDAGTINYRWFLDDMSDQRYDLRVVSVCMIDNVEVENVSEVRSGIKDMYCPRLFGSAQPANGILTINDEIRLNFNETISDGLLTVNNFQVTGVRNGTQTDHSTSIRLDGVNDYFESQFNRNWNGKDITVEMWVLADEPQDATFFSQGNKNESLEFGMTADNKLKVKVGATEIISREAVPYDQGTWAHVAMVLDKDGHVSAYYNFKEYISNVQAEAYAGEGNFVFGRSIATEGNYYAGKMHNARIWDALLTSGRLQTNSLNLLSGTDNNLLAYYPMNEARGTVLEDKARGTNLEMKGGEWVLPDGRSASFNGEQYLEISTSSAVLTSSMDYTIEFWFRGEPGQTNATLVANGRGDGSDMGGSANLFFIGFEEGILTFRNNEVKATADGDYLDNNWHHFTLAVNRTTGRAQILIDGSLNTYFEAQDLGGIAAAKTYLGARVWTSEEDLTTTNKDYFFKGSIDDFRFWNLYKSESIVSESNNERLDGTEKGLLAYYPFEDYIEWQGTKELQFTLADKKVQADPTQKIPDGVVYGGGSLETADTAPVKDKGPVANLLYDFVANDDALIINLNEPWEKVEKTIVTFTVDGVRDINGNEIVSPITWSAYIDRNQLKWSEDELNLEKKVNEPMTFNVQAQNLGGSIQHFTIENMPSWMDVTPTEGTINPKSNLNVTFTIDEGLNIGSYDEVIYMRNDNNVSEALPVNIKVNGEKPDWSVNPKEFKYSMNVYGKLRINNIFSIDKEDMLAAFSNGQCVGVANNQYLKVNDMWYAFLTVYNNDKNADLEFRIWDASTGKIYMATTTETIAFESDAVKGSATNPLIFDAKEMMVQNVAIDEGWNWVSFNVATESLKNVQEILKNNEWTDEDFVKDETNKKFVSFSPKTSEWVGTMTSTGFDNKHMYLIKSSQTQTVSVTGTQVKSKEDLTLPIEQGWNYIGYIPNVNLTLKEALAGYEAQEGDIVKGQSAFSMFGGNLGWLGNLTYMEAGKGYMLHREGETTQLVYPSISGTTAGKTRAMATEAPAYANKQYAQNMSVVAAINGVFETNDRILAYAGSELRGIGKAVKNPANDSTLYFININGEGTEPISFALERKGEIIAKTNAEFDYSSNSVKGNIQNPYVLNFMNEDGKGNVYPNPFDRELNITMSVQPEATFEIIINDISGRLIRQYETQQATNGYIRITLNDLEGLASGVYMLNVKVDGANNVYKVEKK